MKWYPKKKKSAIKTLLFKAHNIKCYVLQLVILPSPCFVKEQITKYFGFNFFHPNEFF